MPSRQYNISISVRPVEILLMKAIECYVPTQKIDKRVFLASLPIARTIRERCFKFLLDEGYFEQFSPINKKYTMNRRLFVPTQKAIDTAQALTGWFYDRTKHSEKEAC